MAEDREAKVLDEVARSYRDRGYRVVVGPNQQDLPPELANFRPDLLAVVPGESIVVEVTSHAGLSANQNRPALAKAVAAMPGWRLDLIVAEKQGADRMPDEVQEPSSAEVDARIDQVHLLVNDMPAEAGLLMAWSLVEAAMRMAARASGIDLKKIPLSLLLKELYATGSLDRHDFLRLQEIMKVRNLVAHGYSWSAPKSGWAVELLELAKKLLGSIASPA